MNTLADRYPGAVSRLKTMGYVNIAHMMTIFTKMIDVDGALGMNSVSSNWLRQKNTPTHKAERRAEEWLSKQGPHITGPVEATEPVEFINQLAPLLTTSVTDAVPEDEVTTLLVNCSSKSAAKVMKVLGMFDCDFVEV